MAGIEESIQLSSALAHPVLRDGSFCPGLLTANTQALGFHPSPQESPFSLQTPASAGLGPPGAPHSHVPPPQREPAPALGTTGCLLPGPPGTSRCTDMLGPQGLSYPTSFPKTWVEDVTGKRATQGRWHQSEEQLGNSRHEVSGSCDMSRTSCSLLKGKKLCRRRKQFSTDYLSPASI